MFYKELAALGLFSGQASVCAPPPPASAPPRHDQRAAPSQASGSRSGYKHPLDKAAAARPWGETARESASEVRRFVARQASTSDARIRSRHLRQGREVARLTASELVSEHARSESNTNSNRKDEQGRAPRRCEVSTDLS